MAEYNPWDQTIWDPLDPERAIKDPIHGPSAVQDMLQIPAMPRDDGIYYQPGAFYSCGTAYLDSHDRPVYPVGGLGVAIMREAAALQEWFTAYNDGGEEALTVLEAARQNERLIRTGAVSCFKLSDVCPGGKKLEDCDTGSTAYEATEDWAVNNNEEQPVDGTVSTRLVWIGGKCAECLLSCSAAVTTANGRPPETRVSFYVTEPARPEIPLDLADIMMTPTDKTL